MNDFLEMSKIWIKESNLIEGIDNKDEDYRSVEAWKKLTEEKELTIKAIKDCHWDIMNKLNPLIAGDFRKCNVRVGDHVCPAWKQVPNHIKKWFGSYANERTKSGIIKAHIRFEWIHPFEDGNGRVGRMIMNYQLFKNNLDIICIYAQGRKEYYKWFKSLTG